MSPRFNADRRYAVRSSEIGRAQRCWCGFRASARCRSETGAPSLYAILVWAAYLAERAKTMAANSVRCPRDRGESVKGGPPPPFHKSTMTNRNSPPRAAGAQGSFDCRREAPGGPRTGPQLQAELRPKAIPDQGPVRGPLDPDCRSEAPTGRTGQAPSLYATWCGRRLASAQKTMAANSVRARVTGRESVKGGPPPPFHKSTMTNRTRRRSGRRQGSFVAGAAPGGPRTGPQLPSRTRPKAIPDRPVRGPLALIAGGGPHGRTGRRSIVPALLLGAAVCGSLPAQPPGTPP